MGCGFGYGSVVEWVKALERWLEIWERREEAGI